jgi:magnesium-transporting ATPase (P-type)
MIHNYSTLKFRGYDDFVKRLSFGGYRSIAFGCKSIDEEELPRYLAADREVFLKETSIFGVVTFINRLKDDAASTLTALGAADITTKIITGDNIFLGIQTAFATGIIQQDKTVVVLEGSRYDHSTKSADLLYLTRSPSGEISEHRKLVESFEYPLHGDEVYAIDNDFIRANPEGFLSDRVKVFARISP